MCYERGWEARQRNEEATRKIRSLFARYRAEAQRAREPLAERPPVRPVEREERRKLVLR